jgi:hypothetical protein
MNFFRRKGPSTLASHQASIEETILTLSEQIAWLSQKKTWHELQATKLELEIKDCCTLFECYSSIKNALDPLPELPYNESVGGDAAVLPPSVRETENDNL